ncbi:hypothetical protein AAVH_12925 [Aphelenchoides avenae]|nr:hypothetical protein AAVH_12925 [Aphelenchus avenae]
MLRVAAIAVVFLLGTSFANHAKSEAAKNAEHPEDALKNMQKRDIQSSSTAPPTSSTSPPPAVTSPNATDPINLDDVVNSTSTEDLKSGAAGLCVHAVIFVFVGALAMRS